MAKRLIASKAIIKECQACTNTMYYTERCRSTICFLSDFRTGEYLTTLKKIRAHCSSCAPDLNTDNCEVEDCHLWMFRHGKDPVRSAAMKKAYKNSPAMQAGSFKSTGSK